jgi:hypothetical protein
MSSETHSGAAPSASGRAFAATDESVEASTNSSSADELVARIGERQVNRASAGRVRSQDFNAISAEIWTLIKTKPGLALAAAAILGFVLGKALSARG